MSFLSLAFLWGLPLLGIPIAIHLLSRRRQEVVRWAAMQLLLASNIRRRSIWRIDDLILMLLRAAAILGLVLALARPMWHGANLAGGADRQVIFIWDVSLSMGRTLSDGDAFQRMLTKTEELFAKLGPTDSVQGLVTIGPGVWLSTESRPATEDTKRQLLASLREMGVTESSADWMTCLNTAIRAEVHEDKRARLIIALSDGQAEGWRAADSVGWQNLLHTARAATISTAINIYNVLEATSAPGNLGINQLTTTRNLVGLGQTVLLEAVIENYGQTSQSTVELAWDLDGERLGTSTVGPIHPGETSKVLFLHTTQKVGLQKLTCELLAADELPADNRQSLVLETIGQVSVLIVDDSVERDLLRTDRGYLLAALGQQAPAQRSNYESNVYRVKSITSAELSAEPLSAYRAVIFPNLPLLEENLVTQLTNYVRNGGGLWLALGDRTRPTEFRTQVYRLGSGLSPWSIESGVGDINLQNAAISIHPPEADHPATSLLGDTQRLDIDRVQIFRHYPFVMRTGRNDVSVLLKSGAGEPLVIESFLGQGRIIIQSFPLGVAWSHLPLTQAYVPLVREWLSYLIQPSSDVYNLRPGEPLQISLPLNDHIRDVQLRKPHGEVVRLKPFTRGDRQLAIFRDTLLPGGYSANVEREGKSDDVRWFQVARVPAESNLTPWPADFAQRSSSDSVISINPQVPMMVPTGAAGRETGKPLWELFLLAVVIAILTEVWLARWIASRRTGGSTSANPVPWTGLSARLTATSRKGTR